MVKTYYVDKIMTDSEIENSEGEHFDESHYKLILDHDADVYTKEGKLLLKLRKNVIPDSVIKPALESLYRDATEKKHENRGASAGVLDRNKMANALANYLIRVNLELI